MTRSATRMQQKNPKRQEGNVKVVVEPVFIKGDQLKPGTNGHNLTVNVLKSNTVLSKNRTASSKLRQTRMAERLVGDDTATILFTVRNDQDPCCNRGKHCALNNRDGM